MAKGINSMRTTCRDGDNFKRGYREQSIHIHWEEPRTKNEE